MALTTNQIRGLSDDLLLAKIAEESSEVTKAVMKQFVHGPTPLFDGVYYNNVADTVEEFHQLQELMAEYTLRFTRYMLGPRGFYRDVHRTAPPQPTTVMKAGTTLPKTGLSTCPDWNSCRNGGVECACAAMGISES